MEIRAHASLGIKIACAGDRPIVQHFVISVAHTGFICESFGFEPQPVEIRTDPAFAVPTAHLRMLTIALLLGWQMVVSMAGEAYDARV
jgi:hypothetical protein